MIGSNTEGAVELRDVVAADLPTLFAHQCDPAAARLAAFQSRDAAAFMQHWTTKVLGDPAVVKKAILFHGELVGHVGCWLDSGSRMVGYWIGRDFWGKGIATAALTAFVAVVEHRPLHALVARHNLGSVRVLEKCGFVRTGAMTVPATGSLPAVDELEFTLGDQWVGARG